LYFGGKKITLLWRFFLVKRVMTEKTFNFILRWNCNEMKMHEIVNKLWYILNISALKF
jgi:hypothetical protein